jgi:hypothetical protein
VYNGGGPVTITNSTISGNTASFVGGGVFAYANAPGASRVTITNCMLSDNTGGGVYNKAGGFIFDFGFEASAVLTIAHSMLSDNSGRGYSIGRCPPGGPPGATPPY